MAACHGAALVSLITFLPIYLRAVRGASPAETGLMLLPLTAGIGLGSMITGQMVTRTGRTAIFPTYGLMAATAGLLFLAFWTPHLSTGELPWVFGVIALFMGTVMGVVQVTVQAVAGPRLLGTGAAMVQFSRSVGAAFGTATVAAILFSILAATDRDTANLFGTIIERGPEAIATLAPARQAVDRGRDRRCLPRRLHHHRRVHRRRHLARLVAAAAPALTSRIRRHCGAPPHAADSARQIREANHDRRRASSFLEGQYVRIGRGCPNRVAQLPEPFTAEKFVPMMDEAGVDRAVIVPPSWEGDRNDCALEAVVRYPGRFAIMGRIPVQDPKSAALLAGLEEAARHGRDQGDVSSAQWSWLTDGTVDWFWPAAEKYGLPVMFYGAPMPNFARVAERHPQLPMIADHLGVTGEVAKSPARWRRPSARRRRSPNIQTSR